MRSPGAAIGWEFRHRTRWALIAIVTYWIAVGAYRLATLNPDQEDGFGALAATTTPFTYGFFYLLAVFSYGLAGDLAARQSMYPARMFAMPVSTAALAGWPMLYGTAAVASLWLATVAFARWPWGIELPVLWPAAMAAVFLAWTQVFTWMPYGLPGLRIIVTVFWLIALDAAALLAIDNKVSDSLMVACLLPQLPIAYLAACLALAKARRGDIPDWRGTLVRQRPIAKAEPRRLRNFPSAGRAQLWFEWRRHGRSLPTAVALLLPFELALLFIPGNQTAPAVLGILAFVMVTPMIMAGFIATTVSKANPYVRDSYGLVPFEATRPVTSVALVAAKLKMAAWSTVATWLLVLAAAALAIALANTWSIVIEQVRQGIGVFGVARMSVLAVLTLSGLMVLTWGQLVQTLYVGLTGREWLIKLSVFLTLVVLVFLGPLAQWVVRSSEAKAAIWEGWPLVAATLAAIKMSAAAWLATRLHAGRLLSDRALAAGAAAWVITVFALYGVLVWFFSTPLVPRHVLALVAILAVPLARLSAAPLALAWNRHR